MKLQIGLSTDSVRNAITQLQNYRRSFEKKCNLLLMKLAEIGVEAAVAVVREDTGTLASSIHFERSGDSEYLVVADCEYAAFVEFGTGVVGEGTYNGQLPVGWGYNEQRTPAAHDRDDPTIWYYIDPESGGVASTRGQTANGFMLAAGEEMRQSILRVAKEVFST